MSGPAYVCPCCKARLNEARPSAFFGGKTRQTLELIENSPAGVTVDKIIHELYSLDPNGGPDYAENTVRVRFCQIREKLKRLGWRIEGRGRNPTHYFLVPINAKENAA